MITVSHTSELAETFGRRVRTLVAREHEILGDSLQQDSKPAGRWETSKGGEYYAAGIGGGITGRRADLIVIDDPVKGSDEAKSEKTRQRVWDYYRSELYTRLKPGGRIILVMTRWDEDDLGGRLLNEMGSGGDDWDLLKLPALAEDPRDFSDDATETWEPDPLGRQPGEALWPDWESREALLRKRLAVGELDWFALFQQRPKPPQGVLFNTDKITTLTNRPNLRSIVRSWDLAATEQQGTNDPDWTVGTLLGRTTDDRYVVLDVVRERLPPNGVLDLITSVADNDGRTVPIRLPEDPGQAGKSQSAFMVAKLAGHKVTMERETGSKVVRATPFITQVNVGNVSMLEARWNKGFISELRDFPNGRKDDQVDSVSGAFNIVGTRQPGFRISPDVVRSMGMARR